MQVQDLALARQEVVLDVEALHGLEMAAQHRGRDDVGAAASSFSFPPLFDGMEGSQPQLLAPGCLGFASSAAPYQAETLA